MASTSALPLYPLVILCWVLATDMLLGEAKRRVTGCKSALLLGARVLPKCHSGKVERSLEWGSQPMFFRV